MAIVIEPLGGLGNQLFIYALGLRLARNLNTDLVCDTWNFHGYSWHVYELDTFVNSISRTYSSRLREVFGHKARSLIRRGQSLRLLPKRFGKLYLEQVSSFDPSVLNLSNGSRLNGYFQTARYFFPLAEFLRSQISQPTNPSEWMQEVRSELQALGEWTAVHVRRGNYTFLPLMGLAQDDYYRQAIRLLDSCDAKRPLVFFSDSPALISDLAQGYGARARVMATPSHVRPIDVMQVMSDAASLVIGNSTFSWWAAFLKDRPDRLVVAPRPWLDDPTFNDRDLLLGNWVTVGRGLVNV